MTCRLLFIFRVLLILASVNSADLRADSPLLTAAAQDRRQVVANNRILAKVYNKVLSVIDVQKKMDMLFYQRFPEYADSATLRQQFYQVNFLPVLNDLIDKELILADAKDTKLDISRGDVRQELESLFGPNVIANLAKIGLTFEEAWDMIEGDLLIRRTMMLRVNVHAQKRISPKIVRQKYEEFAQANRRPARWTYQLLSIRHPDEQKGGEIAQVLRGQLAGRRITLAELQENYTSFDAVDEKTKISFSEEFTHTEEEISENYQSILSGLQPLMFSQPVVQESRKSKSKVHRIFYLKEREPGGFIPFSEVEAKLQAEVTSEAVAAETEKYLQRLRRQANVTREQVKQNLPENFEPFQLL